MFPFFMVAVGLVSVLTLIELSQLLLFTLVAIAIFFIGIPHGALDVIVIEKQCVKRLPCQSSAVKRIILYGLYLLLVLACLLFWQYSPLLGLVAFYALAILHFQEDWFELNHFFARVCLAAMLLSASAWFYSDNLTSLFKLLGNTQLDSERCVFLLKLLNSVSLLSVLFIRAFHRFVMAHIKLTSSIILAAYILPPLAFFVAYFCAFHSILHTKQIMNDYHLNKLAFIRWVAVPMIGTGLLALLFFSMYDTVLALGENLFSTTFILLFALTVPHMVLTIWSKKQSRS
jgi:Brp/Blh family beta-carotene 15,15'-monooxygenase